jgi:hypothetical protein
MFQRLARPRARTRPRIREGKTRRGLGWAKKTAAALTRLYVIVGTDRYPNGAIGGAV